MVAAPMLPSHGSKEVAAILDLCNPPAELAWTPTEPTLLRALGGCSFIGYGATMINFAREPYGVGSLRWLVGGRMKILMASAKALAAHLTTETQKAPEEVSEVDMKDYLTRLTAGEAAGAAARGLKIHHCTLTAGHVLYTPPGYLVGSCVLDNAFAYGYARVFFTKLDEASRRDLEFVAAWTALKDMGQPELVQEMLFATHLLGV